MMGLSDGRKSFRIRLAVLIQYRSVTATQPATQPRCRSYYAQRSGVEPKNHPYMAEATSQGRSWPQQKGWGSSTPKFLGPPNICQYFLKYSNQIWHSNQAGDGPVFRCQPCYSVQGVGLRCPKISETPCGLIHGLIQTWFDTEQPNFMWWPK